MENENAHYFIRTSSYLVTAEIQRWRNLTNLKVWKFEILRSLELAKVCLPRGLLIKES